jgi:hypothetical protein
MSDLEIGFLGKIDVMEDHSIGYEEKTSVEKKYSCLKDLQSWSRLRVFRVQIKSQVKEGNG